MHGPVYLILRLKEMLTKSKHVFTCLNTIIVTDLRHLPSITSQRLFIPDWRKDSNDLVGFMCFSHLQLAPTVLTAWNACQRVGTVRMAMCVTRWTGHAPVDVSLGLCLRILFVMKVSGIALIVLTRTIIIDEPWKLTAVTIATISITAAVTITTVAGCVMGFGQSEILVDAENKVSSVTAIRYSSFNPQVRGYECILALFAWCEEIWLPLIQIQAHFI